MQSSAAGHPVLEADRAACTLSLARRKHPGASNSLDALCSRYGIDNSRRTKHGALLDAEILAEVYIELIGGKQADLGLAIGRAAAPRQRRDRRRPASDRRRGGWMRARRPCRFRGDARSQCALARLPQGRLIQVVG